MINPHFKLYGKFLFVVLLNSYLITNKHKEQYDHLFDNDYISSHDNVLSPHILIFTKSEAERKPKPPKLAIVP